MAQDLIDKIREQAQARGLDPEIAVRIAQVESSMDPSAKAKTSSAQGLFQVVDSTWKQFGGKPGKKADVDENIRVGLNILESNTKSLKNALGREPSATELYAAHFLGAQGAKTLLTAAPDTPVSQLLSQRAIKANPSMLKDKNVEQLLGILNTKMGAPAAAVAAAPPTPAAPMPAAAAGAPKRAAPAAPAAPVISKGMGLGTGYQAALALSFLGDEEEDSTPLTREQWQERQEQTSAAQMLADYKPKNALQDINWDESSLLAPRKMADGGEVAKLAAGGLPYVPTALVRPSLRNQLTQADASNTAYSKAVDDYNAAVDAYNANPQGEFTMKEPTAPITQAQYDALVAKTRSDVRGRNMALQVAANPEQYGLSLPKFFADGGDVDLQGLQDQARKGEAYRLMEQYLTTRDAMPDIKAKVLPEPTNAVFTAMRMPAGSGTITVHKDPEVMRVIGPSLMAHELAHAADRQMGQQASEESSVIDGKSQFAEAYDKMVGRGPFVSGKKRTELARKVNPDWASFNKGYRASPDEISAHGVGAFAPSKNMQDSAPLHVDATAATEFQILLELAQRSAKNKATGAVKIPNFLKQMMGFAEGGEVEPTPEELAAASRPAFVTSKSGIGRKISTKPGEIDSAIVQGISEMPYNLVGSVADVGALALRPFGYTNPTPFLGSEQLKQLATRLGVRQAPPEQPTARAFYELGQLGSSLINPVAPVRGAVAAGQAAGRTAQQALQDFQGYNRQLTVPSASYAVKPKGGVSAVTTEPGMGTPMSDLDNLLKDYVVEARATVPESSRETVMEFLRTKAPKYFTNTYGTASDPLREAIRSSRIAPMSKEAKAMPFSLIETARNPQARDHAQAAIELEKAYDDLTGIYGLAYRAPDSTKPPSSFFSSQREKQISAAMGREGVPVEARNPPLVDAYAREEFAEYPYSSRALRAMVESPTLPPHLQRALKEGETIYDAQPSFEMLKPGNVVDALSAIPANKLKNMSFPEALIQGMQATAPLRDYKAAIEIADRGGAVPQAALMKFTQPVVTTDKGTWVRLTDPLATKMEGRLMNHSVDGYAQGESYGTAYTGLPYGGKKAFEEGLAQVYSLRDKNGKPMVTVEVANKGTKEEPKLLVTQVRGRFNSEPAAGTQKAVFDLFDKLDEGGKLKEIRPNSYSVSPTGERLDQGSQVDWGRLYDEWKLDFAE